MAAPTGEALTADGLERMPDDGQLASGLRRGC